MNQYTRRRFLKRGTQTLLGAGLALGAHPLRSLAYGQDLTQSVGDGYRALVCIYLEGGCDGFSLMLPTGSYEQQAFSQARGNLAVSQSDILPLGDGTSPIGLHRSAQALQSHYDSGNLAMISNVGTLIQPTTVEQYNNNAVALPAQLFSHSDQAIQWQQLQGRTSSIEGWGAKAAQYLDAYQQRDYLTSISLAGSNYWQTGATRRPFTLTEDGVLEYIGMNPEDTWEQPRREAFERVLEIEQTHLMTKAYRDLQKHALAVTTELGMTLEGNAGMFDDTPEENPLAAKLAMVAQIIAQQESLGLQRQIFYVTMPGFDVHDNQSQQQPELFSQLATAIDYFQTKMSALGQSDNVTAFTASDFGRSLLSNGDGTDHGWGNHLMAIGGAVRGGRIYGTLPTLSADGPDSVHHGRILPTLSATQYAATLLDWVGLQPHEVNTVLPTLPNFGQTNLGFLA